jgi:hypothetical protein
MRHRTKAQKNRGREDNASVQDLASRRRGWVSLRSQDLLHQNHTSTNESVTGLNSRNSIDFDVIMAVAMETIMKNKFMQERVSERVEE